jgi:hypothetical protein
MIIEIYIPNTTPIENDKEITILIRNIMLMK